MSASARAQATPRNAAIYCRISQDRGGQGLGVERQEEDCRILAERMDWDVVDVYVDNDISAYSGKPRPEYKRLFKDIRSGQINAILAWHPDRLYRRLIDLEELVQVADRFKVEIQTARGGIVDLSSSAGRMNATMIAAANRYESDIKAERVSAARAQRAKAGQWQGGIRPFGFEADGATHRVDEAEEIRKATRALISGASLRGIVVDWNGRGIKTSTGKVWHSRTVRDVLMRPRNSGKMQYKPIERNEKGSVVPNRSYEAFGDAAWDPIVSEEERLAVVSILTDPSRRSSPGNTVKHLGSHLFVCGICGSTNMVVGSAGSSKPGAGKRPPAYKCRNRDSGLALNHLSRVAYRVDDIVEATIIRFLTDPAFWAELPQAEDSGVTFADWNAQLESLRTKREDAKDLWRSEIFTAAELKLELKRIEAQEEEIKAQMVFNPGNAALDGIHPDTVTELWPTLDVGRKRAVIDSMFTVTLNPSTKRGTSFDRDSVVIMPKHV